MKKFFYGFRYLVDVFSFLMLWSVFGVLATKRFTAKMFGDVSLPQLLFFVKYRDVDGVEKDLVHDIILNMGIVPFLGAVMIFFLVRKLFNGKVLFCNQWFLFLYGLFLVLIGWGLYKFFDLITLSDVYKLGVLLFGAYLVNLWRNYSRGNCFWSCMIAVLLVVLSPANYRLVRSLLKYDTSQFYEQNYEFVKKSVKFDKKRNVIVVFAESFENKYAKFEENGETFKINDDEGVKFSEFNEGYSQNWTQGALFSAFTGVHIHYLIEFFRYGVKGFKLNFKERVLMATNKLGKKFDFNTPNIRYLGDITKELGYNNLFVQGGSLSFSGTDKFLLKHGFDEKNVFDIESFRDDENYEEAKNWWGMPDKVVFRKFKDEITRLSFSDKPFLAVMFTLDLHRGINPFYKGEVESAKVTISNLNDFIKWFNEQEWSKDTTLIIVGDHRRMGQKVLIGGDVYNAFINLPENLKNKVDVNRKFNQIDMFPTILEIMGVELKDGRAGVGVSLFSKNKTIAERYSYEEQEEMFSKIDRFYQRIWVEKDSIFGVDFLEKHNISEDKKTLQER